MDRNSARRRRVLLTAAILAASQLPTATFADRTWTAGSGNWSLPTNWSGNVVPTTSDSAYLTFNDGTIRNIFFNDHATINGLLIGNLTGTATTFTQTSAFHLKLTNEFLGVGTASRAAHTQSAGNNTFAGSLYVGFDTNSTALYTLSGAGSLTFNPGGHLIVGNSGKGTFNQSGGTVSVTDYMDLAENIGSVGVYLLSAGNLSAGFGSFLGFQGHGTFLQSGGSATFGDSLSLGVGLNGIGLYALSAGNVNVNGSAFLGGNSGGSGGAGIVNVSGGNMIVAGTLKIYNTGSSAINVSADGHLIVGTLDTSGSPSRFISGWTGGSLSITGDSGLSIDSSGPLGNNITLSTQSLVVTNFESIGGISNGTFTQTGGVNLAGTFALGLIASATGKYTLSGGTALAVTGPAFIGGGAVPGGTGILNIQAGTFGSTSTVKIYDTPGTALNLSGGVLYTGALDTSGNPSRFTSNWTAGLLQIAGLMGIPVGGSPTGLTIDSAGPLGTSFTLSAGKDLTITFALAVGNTGSGTFNQTGGNTTAAALNLGSFSSGSGFYNLSGTGVLSVANENIGAPGVGFFSQTGGTHTISSALTVGDLGLGFMTLNGPTALLTVNGSAFLGGNSSSGSSTGVLNIQSGTMNVANTLKIWNTASTAVNLSGGVLALGTLDTSGNPSRFTSGWTGGTLQITSPAGLTIDANAPFTSLTPGQTLTVNNTLTISGSNVFNLAGGNLHVTTLNLAGSLTHLNWTSGTLTFVNGISIDPAFVLGSSITLAPGKTLSAGALPGFNHGYLNLNGGAVTTSYFTNSADGILSGPGNINGDFANDGTLLIPDGLTTLTTNLSNAGVIELAGNAANLSIPGNTLFNISTIEGHGKISASLTNFATIEALGGTLVLAGPTVNNGLIAAPAGSKILMQGAATFPQNDGLISLNGGTFDNGGQPLDNFGQIIGFGILRTGGLTNYGILTLTGGTSTINGPVTNTPGQTLNIKFQPAIFTGPVVNSGTIKITDTTAIFANSYTGNAYISDPSDNLFQNNVTVLPGGSMTGTSGDRFFMSGGTFNNQGAFINSGLLQSSSPINNSGTFVQSGTLTQSAHFTNSGTTTLSGTQAWAAGTTFTNTAGTTNLLSDAGATNTFKLNLHISGGTLTANVPQHLASLVMDAAGSVDLKNNYLLLGPGNSSNTLRTYLLSAYNNGTWTGPGLKSSSLSPAQALAYMDANVYNIFHPDHLFQGQTLVGNELLTKITWQGDADLSGYITMNDYAQLQAGFFFGHFNSISNPAPWAYGDFNYDGNVNFQDFALIDNAFHLQSGTLADDMIEQHSLQFGPSYTQFLNSLSTPIPEPTSLALLLVAAPALLRRRPAKGTC